MSLATSWGTRPEERLGPWPCDQFASPGAATLWRGVDVRAPAWVIWRWLCQLRVAPYSYDWLDNGGRRSPRALTPGLERLAVGQPVMRIFRIASFLPERHLTLTLAPGGGERLFGRIALTYRVVPRDDGPSRLLAKLRFEPAPGLLGALVGMLLPWGDLVMMRKQLLTLARLAEAGPHT